MNKIIISVLRGIHLVLSLFVLSCTFLFCDIVTAAPYGNKDPEILNNMYNDISRYIRIGTDNFGLSFYLDKESVVVHQYDPPNYIIAFKPVYHVIIYPEAKEEITGYFVDHKSVSQYTRYKYNYTDRTMYIESYDDNGKTFWKYIDVSPLTSEQKKKKPASWFRIRQREISAGEIAFYLAYGIKFYQPTVMATDFLDEHKTELVPLLHLNLETYGQGTKYEYNYKTKQIEIWKYTYDDKTKQFNRKRMK